MNASWNNSKVGLWFAKCTTPYAVGDECMLGVFVLGQLHNSHGLDIETITVRIHGRLHIYAPCITFHSPEVVVSHPKDTRGYFQLPSHQPGPRRVVPCLFNWYIYWTFINDRCCRGRGISWLPVSSLRLIGQANPVLTKQIKTKKSASHTRVPQFVGRHRSNTG